MLGSYRCRLVAAGGGGALVQAFYGSGVAHGEGVFISLHRAEAAARLSFVHRAERRGVEAELAYEAVMGADPFVGFPGARCAIWRRGWSGVG